MNWNTTIEEYKKIARIANRALKGGKKHKLNLIMDITATHCNGCPLDLDKFLNAKDFDFYHDIYGIMDHIDRYTGELQDCFLPRCTRPSE